MDKQPIRVVVIEDVPDDAELMILRLRQDGFAPDWLRIEEEPAFLQTLDDGGIDVILADFSLPRFSGPRALEILKSRGLDIPLILVSGTIGEETAVEAIKQGAFDYLLKGKLARLAASVRNALHEKRLRDEASAAEAALRGSEIRFRKLIENAPDAYALVDEAGRLKYASPSAQRLLGYSPDEIVGADPARATHPDDLPGLLAHLTEVLKNPDRVVTAKYRYLHKDGSWHWLESTMTNQFAEPSLRALVFNFRDVTDQHRAEDDLRKAEEKYRTLVEQLPVITYLDRVDDSLDHGGFTTSYLSPQVEHLLGYSPEDFYADPDLWMRLIHPEHRERILAEHAVHFNTKRPFAAEYPLHARDDRLVWVRDQAVIVTGEGGAIFSQGIVVDITQQKQTEGALRESEARKAAIIESSLDCMITMDHEGRIIEFNPAAARTFGYAREQVIGRELADLLIPAAQRPLHREGLTRWLATGQGPVIGKRLELTALRADGSEFPVELTVTALATASHPIFTGFLRDITERSRSQEALRDSESRYRLLFQSNPAPMWVYDVETLAFLAVNDAAVDKYGYSQREFLSMTIRDIRPSDELAKLDANLLAGASVTERSSGWRHRTKEGTLIDVEITSHGIEFGSRPARMVLVNDVTERKRHESELEAIAQVSAALRKAATRAEMVPIILDQLLQLLKMEAAALAMRDTISGETVIELARGAWSAGTGRRFPPGEGVSGQVILTGNAYMNDDITNDPRYIPLLPGAHLHAAACVPLKTQDQTIGTLWIARNSPIEAAETRLLTAVSNIAASAIQRATLFEQTQRRLQQISALHSIDIAISSSFDLRFTLSILLEQVSSHLGVDATDVLLLNPNTQMLEYVAGRGFMSVALDRLRFRLGEGSAGRAAMERRIISIPNLQEQESRTARRELLTAERFVSYHGVPLIAKGQIKGVLEIFHRSPLAPDPDWLSFLETLAEQAAIAINDATMFDSLQRSNTELILAYDATIEGWSRALDLRDNETEGHTQRVAATTIKMARTMSLSDAELIHVRRGALLHDIGKMGIPDAILLKPDKLTKEEWVVMRKHPQYAYDLIRPIEFLRPAIDIPYCHHEKWDGTGYPRGLKGEHIPLSARMFSLADVWDALRSDRPYRTAWSAERARDYIVAERGKHFDPAMVDVFLSLEDVVN